MYTYNMDIEFFKNTYETTKQGFLLQKEFYLERNIERIFIERELLQNLYRKSFYLERVFIATNLTSFKTCCCIGNC